MAAPSRTTLNDIVDAGRAVLESEGLAGLTMQAVAARVGVRPPSLYKRVRDRDALVEMVATAINDDLAARMEAAPQTVAGLAYAYRDFAQAQPEGFRLLSWVKLPQEAVSRAAGPVIDLARNMVGEEQSLEAARFITAWANGFVSMQLAGAFQLDGDLDAAFEFGVARVEFALLPT